MSVLYVEDDNEISNVFISYLEKFFNKIIHKKNGQDGLESYKKEHFDLVITDIEMPIMDGLEMARQIKQINNEQNILVVSAYSDMEKFIRSIKIGIDGYVLKPIDFSELNNTLYKTLLKIKRFKDNKLYEEKLEDLIYQKSDEVLKLKDEKIENYKKILFGLINLIESRDIYTGKHSVRVAEYAKLIAQNMGFSSKECEEIYNAGILHDIGKVAIPDTLLLKPSSLNENEYDLIKEHVVIGVNMLIKIPMFKNIADIISTHHERLDGTGYPKGLRDDEIPILGNILAVADSFDAMTTSRIYKHRKNVDEALIEIKSLENIHFRKHIVEVACECLKDIEIDLTINQIPITSLEKERFSYFYKDSLTELYNDQYLDIILNKNMYEKEFDFLNLIFLDNFGKYNENNGWVKGDELLKNIAVTISQNYPESLVFRIHGDDFIVLSTKEIPFDKKKLELINNLLNDTNITVSTISYEIFKEKIDSVYKLETII